MNPREAARAESIREVSSVRSAGLLRSSPQLREASQRGGVVAHEIVRFEPDATIADVGGLDDDALHDLPLNADVPLVHARRPATLGIVDLRAPRRRHIQLSRRRPNARIERRLVQVLDVVDETVPKPQRGFAERGVRPVDRVEADAERRRTARHVPPVRERAVGQAPTGTQDGLVIQLVRRPEPRTEGVRIRLREFAVAASGPEALVHEPAGQSPGGRIRRRQTDLAGAVEPLVALPAVVPAQPVVERELAGDSPVVLRVQAPRLLPPLRIANRRDAGLLDEAEEEARVAEADAAAAEILALRRREPGLPRVEEQLALRVRLVDVRPDFLLELRAELEHVLAADVGRVRDGGELVVVGTCWRCPDPSSC